MFRKLLLYLCLLVLASKLLMGCGKPGGKNNFTSSQVTVVSITDTSGKVPLQSDVVTNGFLTDDVATVTVRSQSVDQNGPTTPFEPGPLDNIVLNQYRVDYFRTDGGAVPASFNGTMNLFLAPNTEASTNIVIVRAFDKNRSPLVELREGGEIFATVTITLFGEDGFGNDISTSGSINVSFGNFPDQGGVGPAPVPTPNPLPTASPTATPTP
ncbi:MAG TPA: hypothetical protein VNM22_07070 [Candidatus Limnocylindrales bacterium]|nr:hypothetical protein [Candidatus Limnocylindrales bacterium]